MSRPNFRPRPIDVFRKLPIVRSARDLEDEDAPAAATKESQQLDPEVQEEVLLQEALAQVNEIRNANIPVPKVVDVELYDVDNAHKFDRPQMYIRFKEKTLDEWDAKLLYECDTEDEDFIKSFGGEKKGLSEAKLEAIIDRLEKESFKLQGAIPPVTCLDGKVQGRAAVLAAVHEHYSKRRAARGKSLIRRFQQPTPATDPSPHATFRPRERETKHYRRTRKNEKDAYQKLMSLRLDFDRARTLLSLILNRERLKKDMVELHLNLQLAQVLREKDPLAALAILREQETKLKRRQALVIDNKKGAKIKPKKEKAEVVLPSEPSESEEESEEEEEEEEETVAQPSLMPMSRTKLLERRFRRMMVEWDAASSDDEYPTGSGIMPVTADGVLLGQPGAVDPVLPGRGGPIMNHVQASHSLTPQPRRGFHIGGRARMGRGGRIIFDRCPRVVQPPVFPQRRWGHAPGVCNMNSDSLIVELSSGPPSPKEPPDARGFDFRVFAAADPDELSDVSLSDDSDGVAWPCFKKARVGETTGAVAGSVPVIATGVGANGAVAAGAGGASAGAGVPVVPVH